eukprot:738889-Rhodomonas_salina.1
MVAVQPFSEAVLTFTGATEDGREGVARGQSVEEALGSSNGRNAPVLRLFNSTGTSRLNRPCLEPKGVILLEGGSIELEHKKRKNSFALQPAGGGDVLYFSCSSPEEVCLPTLPRHYSPAITCFATSDKADTDRHSRHRQTQTVPMPGRL